MSSKVQAERFEEDPEEELASRPRQHLGVMRRPVPISKLQRQTKSRLSASVKRFKSNILAAFEGSGVLEFAYQDALERQRKRVDPRWKAPVGVGGTPLGPDARREIQRFFNANGVDFMSSLSISAVKDWELELEAILYEQGVEAYNIGGQAARATLGVRGGFNLRNPFIVQTLRDRANMLAGGIADSEFERLKTVFAEGFYLRGENPLTVARTMEQEFNFLSRDRANLVARTEAVVITGGAQQQCYQASGVEFKRWLTTLDGRERESHFEAHGQLVPINEPFIVGDEELQFPGDPDGDIKEIANCRCSHIAVVSAEQVFSDANVWAGDVDPDQFSRERLQAA